MLRSEYCIARAERLRMLMLTASDPASAVRLRGFVEKYAALKQIPTGDYSVSQCVASAPT